VPEEKDKIGEEKGREKKGGINQKTPTKNVREFKGKLQKKRGNDLCKKEQKGKAGSAGKREERTRSGTLLRDTPP